MLGIKDPPYSYRLPSDRRMTMPLLRNRAKQQRAISLRAGGLSYREIGAKLKMTAREARQLVLSGLTQRGVPVARRALLTSQQAADLAGIHVNTLRRWGDQGLIKEFRIGPRNDRRFLRRDVETLLVRVGTAPNKKQSMPEQRLDPRKSSTSSADQQL